MTLRVAAWSGYSVFFFINLAKPFFSFFELTTFSWDGLYNVDGRIILIGLVSSEDKNSSVKISATFPFTFCSTFLHVLKPLSFWLVSAKLIETKERI